MYTEIEIHSTYNPKKFLFVKDDNILFGGFIIKDIIEMLKDDLTTSEITSRLSEKYKTNIDDNYVLNIIDTDIKKLLKKNEKSRILKIFKISIPKDLHFSKKLFLIFDYKIFYPILFFTLCINTIFFFKTSQSNEELTIIDNLVYLLILILIFAFHELGHIISSKNENINVKEAGLAMYAIFPVFYVNLNESWKLEREKKIRINLSGIYFQLIIGVIILFLLHYTQIKSNILSNLFFSNFIVIIINLNPFFKFDGYWVLSDLIKENNLQKKSIYFLKGIFKKNSIKYSNRIKIYSILKLIFFSIFVPLIVYNFYLFVYSNFQNIDLKILFLSILIILIFIFKRNGFKKTKTIN